MPTTLINVGADADDAGSLRNRYDISKDIKDRPADAAHRRSFAAAEGVGRADAYADALADAPTDALRQADLENAEAALAMHFALPGLNTVVTPKGVVKNTREGGRPDRPRHLQHLTPQEIRLHAQTYLEQAEEIARPYMLADGTPDAPSRAWTNLTNEQGFNQRGHLEGGCCSASNSGQCAEVGAASCRRARRAGEVREEAPKDTHNLEQGVSSYVETGRGLLQAEVIVSARTGRLGRRQALLIVRTVRRRR